MSTTAIENENEQTKYLCEPYLALLLSQPAKQNHGLKFS
jgi:hypothetical protein